MCLRESMPRELARAYICSSSNTAFNHHLPSAWASIFSCILRFFCHLLQYWHPAIPLLNMVLLLFGKSQSACSITPVLGLWFWNQGLSFDFPLSWEILADSGRIDLSDYPGWMSWSIMPRIGPAPYVTTQKEQHQLSFHGIKCWGKYPTTHLMFKQERKLCQNSVSLGQCKFMVSLYHNVKHTPTFCCF